MPIISPISARSTRGRILYAAMYLLLALGAATMIYPLLMMVGGSLKSDTDFDRLSPWPEYLWNDDVLWTKYLQSKYSSLDNLERWHRTHYGSWRLVKPPALDHVELAGAFRTFRATHLPLDFFMMGHAEYKQVVAKNARVYRRLAERMSGGDMQKFSAMSGYFREDWSKVGPPLVNFPARRFRFPQNLDFALYYQVTEISPPADRIAVDLDAVFVHEMLMILWPDIGSYNAAHATHFDDYQEVTLEARAPSAGQQRLDWETYVRNELNLAYIQMAPDALQSFRSFLRGHYKSIDELDAAWNQNLSGFDQVQFPDVLKAPMREVNDLSNFVKDRNACPLDALSVVGPRQAFEDWMEKNIPAKADTSAIIPTRTVDWLDFQDQKSALRWEFLTRNYRTVLDFLLIHGNGIRNTIIFCALMVITNLLVNPLAAYALSRYRLPSTYAILLFCMATMAFPAEVTMIPSFLLLKQFHLLNTFWALVLPGMANGFSIFLLKGYFDSLPRELYEAADIDGAGEWTKFWVLTMNLSRPILAVLALNAFVAAYTEFMMALVIIPDQKMWTMMVWLFELQDWAHPTVIYASLVIAAIPTLVIFILCQGVIMRGIVVPTEK